MTNSSDFNFFEEKPLADISISELQAMVTQAFKDRAAIDEDQKKLDERSASLELLKMKILDIMQAHNMKTFPVSEYGKVSPRTKFNVAMPKDQDQAQKLRDYLRSIDAEALLTVNHMTLNAYFDSKVDELQAEGKTVDLDNVLPGVAKPTARVVLAMEKERK